MRLCDLGLRLEESAVAPRVERLRDELARRGLRFRPHVWLSVDWFTPDGVPGLAVPFYLAHRRLVRLERRHMAEVEGGSRDQCLRLLRHETGHAICNAYRLHRRKRWRAAFGSVATPYRATYVPKPYSRKYVVNLRNWYAQSHPLEDFAETFAVWLQPGTRWRRDYDGWPALRKLELVDELMSEIAGRPALERSRERPESLPRMRITLREHYAAKQARYGGDWVTVDVRDLFPLFSNDPAHAKRRSAAAFLREHRTLLRRRVARLTGQHRYVVDQALDEMIDDCLIAGLRLARGERETRLDAAIVLTVRVMNQLHGGYPTYAR